MNYPHFITKPIHRYYWHFPWRIPSQRRKAYYFKKLLWDNGYLSPNFTRAEAASGDGQPIPGRHRHKAQTQAIAMEVVRHLCGDRPISVGSWYRSPTHNAAVGGASKSQHKKARACDVFDSVIEAIGVARWNNACNRVFAKRGIGYAYGTRVRHVDSRPWYARWWY